MLKESGMTSSLPTAYPPDQAASHTRHMLGRPPIWASPAGKGAVETGIASYLSVSKVIESIRGGENCGL